MENLPKGTGFSLLQTLDKNCSLVVKSNGSPIVGGLQNACMLVFLICLVIAFDKFQPEY